MASKFADDTKVARGGEGRASGVAEQDCSLGGQMGHEV